MSLSYHWHELQRQLEKIRIPNAIHKKFVPEKELFELMTREIISNVVEQIQPHYHIQEIQELINFILRGARKVFAVLVLSNQPAHIKNFVRRDQLQPRHVDDLLPFEKPELLKILPDDYSATLFYDRQWEFSVPVFSGNIIPRDLADQTILPFLTDTPFTEGGYASVYKIMIHPSHQPHTYGPNAVVSYRHEIRQGSLLSTNSS